MYAQTALAFADWFIAEELPIEWIVVDMEMDRRVMEQVVALLAEGRALDAVSLVLDGIDPDGFAAAATIYQQMVDDLADRGFYTMVVTLSANPRRSGRRRHKHPGRAGHGRIAGPVARGFYDGLHHPTFPDYTGGLPFGPYAVYEYGRETVRVFGDKASIALGVVRAQTDPANLAAEVAAAKAAGIERIQIYAYAETLEKDEPAVWQNALNALPHEPRPEWTTQPDAQWHSASRSILVESEPLIRPHEEGRMRILRLISVDDMGRRIEIPLLPGANVIGRRPGCQVHVDDPECSREHALIRVADDGAWIRDLGSENATLPQQRNHRRERLSFDHG